MKRILAAIAVLLASPLAAGAARPQAEHAWRSRVSTEIERMAKFAPDYRGCDVSSTQFLPSIDKEIASIKAVKNAKLTVFMAVFGGDYVSISYFVLGHDDRGPFVVGDGDRFDITAATEQRIERLMKASSRSHPLSSMPSHPQSTDNLACTVAVDLASPSQRVLSSLSNDTGFDQRALSKLADTFDAIRESAATSDDK
jgi:hypothetical protein